MIRTPEEAVRELCDKHHLNLHDIIKRKIAEAIAHDRHEQAQLVLPLVRNIFWGTNLNMPDELPKGVHVEVLYRISVENISGEVLKAVQQWLAEAERAMARQAKREPDPHVHEKR